MFGRKSNTRFWPLTSVRIRLCWIGRLPTHMTPYGSMMAIRSRCLRLMGRFAQFAPLTFLRMKTSLYSEFSFRKLMIFWTLSHNTCYLRGTNLHNCQKRSGIEWPNSLKRICHGTLSLCQRWTQTCRRKLSSSSNQKRHVALMVSTKMTWKTCLKVLSTPYWPCSSRSRPLMPCGPPNCFFGTVIGTAKRKDAHEESHFRPITLFSMLLRCWAKLRTQMAQFMPAEALGFLPHREAAEILLLLQGQIEIMLAMEEPFGGLSSDVKRAFNHIGRKQVFHMGSQVSLVNFCRHGKGFRDLLFHFFWHQGLRWTDDALWLRIPRRRSTLHYCHADSELGIPCLYECVHTTCPGLQCCGLPHSCCSQCSPCHPGLLRHACIQRDVWLYHGRWQNICLGPHNHHAECTIATRIPMSLWCEWTWSFHELWCKDP